VRKEKKLDMIYFRVERARRMRAWATWHTLNTNETRHAKQKINGVSAFHAALDVGGDYIHL